MQYRYILIYVRNRTTRKEMIEMKYMVNWMEFDKGLNREIEWTTYFERRSEAETFMDQQAKKGFTGIKLTEKK